MGEQNQSSKPAADVALSQKYFKNPANFHFIVKNEIV